MTELEMIRHALTRLKPEDKWNTGDQTPRKFDECHASDDEDLRQHGVDTEIRVWGGYTGFYSVIDFDADGRIIDIRAYE